MIEELVVWSDWLLGGIATHVVTPLVILLIGFMAGKLTRNLIVKTGQAVRLDAHAREIFGQRMRATQLLAGAAAAIIYTVTVVWALQRAGILVWALRVVGIFFGILAILALWLWLREASVNLLRRKPARDVAPVGKRILVNGVRGTVTKHTRLGVVLSHQKEEVWVPNVTLAASRARR